MFLNDFLGEERSTTGKRRCGSYNCTIKNRRKATKSKTSHFQDHGRQGTSTQEIEGGQGYSNIESGKRKCTVIMDTKNYEEKISLLLNDTKTYRKLITKFNPLNEVTGSVNKFIYPLFTSKKIERDKYWLHCSKALVPRFYCPPKMHEPNVPLRPIVSFINLQYTLLKFLAKIISALVLINLGLKIQPILLTA